MIYANRYCDICFFKYHTYAVHISDDMKDSDGKSHLT